MRNDCKMGKVMEVAKNPHPTVTRLEVIDHTTNGKGRVFTNRNCQIELSYQDGKQTLKVFVTDPKESNG